MIRLSAEFLFMCAVGTRPTVFVDNGECIAICTNKTAPEPCYNETGESITDCFDNDGRSQLCDAYFIQITDDQYEFYRE